MNTENTMGIEDILVIGTFRAARTYMEDDSSEADLTALAPIISSAIAERWSTLQQEWTDALEVNMSENDMKALLNVQCWELGRIVASDYAANESNEE